MGGIKLLCSGVKNYENWNRKETMNIKFVVLLALTSMVLSQSHNNHTGEAEIIIFGLGEYDYVTATTDNGFALDNNLNRNNQLNTAVSKKGPAGGLYANQHGIDLIGTGQTDLNSIGYGLYKIHLGDIENNYFWVDMRHCGSYSGTPDLVLQYDGPNISKFWFSRWAEDIEFNVIPGDTIRLSWISLTDSELRQNNPYNIQNQTDYSCYQTQVLLMGKNENENPLNAEFYIPYLNQNIVSGNTGKVLRGEYSYIKAVKNVGTYAHHNWEIGNNPIELKYWFAPDQFQSLTSVYEEQKQITVSSNLSPIQLSILDPWRGNGGNSDFHTLENPSYNVFLNESMVHNDPTTAIYAVSAPSINYSHNGINYIFTGWSGTGAELAPYSAGDELKRKVLFQQAGAEVTANYMRMDAMEGMISRDMIFSGNMTVSGTVTIAPGAHVTFSPGAVVSLDPGAKIIVNGSLTASHAQFVSSGGSQWNGIVANGESNINISHSTLSGATTALSLNHLSYPIVNNNTFENNGTGLVSAYSTVNMFNNVFRNNTTGLAVYGGNKTVTFTNNIVENNSLHGMYVQYGGMVSTTVQRHVNYFTSQPNNRYSNNGLHSVSVGMGAYPDFGTYSLSWKANYINGGFNDFVRGNANHDIYKSTLYWWTLNGVWGCSWIKAEGNWWSSRNTSCVDVYPTADDFSSTGGNLFAKGNGQDDTAIDTNQPRNAFLFAGDSLAADSIYDKAIDNYTSLITSMPDDTLALVALARLASVYTRAGLDTAWMDTYNETTFKPVLEGFVNQFNYQLTGRRAFDMLVSQNMYINGSDAAFATSEDYLQYLGQFDSARVDSAFGLLEQALILESGVTPGSNHTAGKERRRRAQEVYREITLNFKNTDAAKLAKLYLNESWDDPTIEQSNTIPESFTLYHAYPNPFNPSTVIQYFLPENGHVTLTIYDLLGEEVKTLVNGNVGTGFQKVQWDGTNHNGNHVPAGMYFYKLTAQSNESGETFSKSMKMVLLK